MPDTEQLNSLRLLILDSNSVQTQCIRKTLKKHQLRLREFNTTVEFDTEETADWEDTRRHMDESQPDLVIVSHVISGLLEIDILGCIATGENHIYNSFHTSAMVMKDGIPPFNEKEVLRMIEESTRGLFQQRLLRKMSEERKQIRFRFLTLFAQELKAPVNAIHSYLSLLSDNILDDNPDLQNRILSRCLTLTEGMNQLIKDQYTLTRIESGNAVRMIENINLNSLFNSLIDAFRPDLENSGIKISLDAPDDVSMIADKAEIEMIINNLLSNAVKYNRDGGSIEISVSENSGKVIMIFADSGIGMTKSEKSQVFQEYARVRNRMTENIVGTGLGLSIVKKLVLLYGGGIKVDSSPSKGTRFTVTLPKAQR